MRPAEPGAGGRREGPSGRIEERTGQRVLRHAVQDGGRADGRRPRKGPLLSPAGAGRQQRGDRRPAGRRRPPGRIRGPADGSKPRDGRRVV